MRRRLLYMYVCTTYDHVCMTTYVWKFLRSYSHLPIRCALRNLNYTKRNCLKTTRYRVCELVSKFITHTHCWGPDLDGKSVVYSSDLRFLFKNISVFVVNFLFLLTDIRELTKLGRGNRCFWKKFWLVNMSYD